jgi:hypothetical protein
VRRDEQTIEVDSRSLTTVCCWPDLLCIMETTLPGLSAQLQELGAAGAWSYSDIYGWSSTRNCSEACSCRWLALLSNSCNHRFLLSDGSLLVACIN